MRTSSTSIPKIFIQRLLIWLTAGIVDEVMLAVTGRAGEVSSGWIDLRFFWIYLAIAVFSTILALIIGSAVTAARLERAWAVDIVLSFLLVIGFRINEVLLPYLWDIRSIAVNIFLLAVSLVLGFFAVRVNAKEKSPGQLRARTFGLAASVILISILPGALREAYVNNAPSPAGKPSIVLVTLDTVRADHLGCYGYDRPTSPSLDAFASECNTFTNCRTPMPLTSPAHASLFSGRLPHELGVLTNASRYPADPGLRTLAEDLARIGYTTAGFPSAVHMGRRFNFDRGFQVYNESSVLADSSMLRRCYLIAPFAVAGRLGMFEQTYLMRKSAEVNSAFFELHRNLRGTRRPFFVWLHYFDAHAPYDPPEEYWRPFDSDYRSGFVTGSQDELRMINEQMDRTNSGALLPDGFSQDDLDNLIARYDGEIRLLDESFGELITYLKSQASWRDTVVIVVSDHGEGLYDDGYFGHNFTLKEYEIRLACIVRGPGINCPEDRQLSITDLSDYIRHVAGLSSGPCRLTGAEETDELGVDPHVSMVFLRSHSWTEGEMKLVRTYAESGQGVSYSLYDLAKDPVERNDLYTSTDPQSAALRESLLQWISASGADFPDLLKRHETVETIDRSTLEMLRSLGYIY